jgi:hypothetical protein
VPTAASDHQRPTSGAGAPVVGVALDEGPGDAEVEDAAEGAGEDLLAEQTQAGVPAQVVADGEFDVASAAADDGGGVGDAGGHRLLDEHVLAGAGRRDRLGGVQAIGGGEDDGVQVGVGEHRRVVGVHGAAGAVAGRERGGAGGSREHTLHRVASARRAIAGARR